MEKLAQIEKIAGSFRDPSGFVFEKNGQIFRTITSYGIDNFNKVQATGLLDDLVDSGLLIPWQEDDNYNKENSSEETIKVLKHPKLDFISYPYEWTFSALKEAALLHLKIQLLAIDKDIIIIDASAYNIQFDGANPIFIDHLSFRPYLDGEYWLGHRQFCEQFLCPLLLQSYLGIPFHAWYRGMFEGICYTDLANILPLKAKISPTVFTNIVLPALMEKRSKMKSNTSVSNTIKHKKLPKNAYKGLVQSLSDYISRLEPNFDKKTVWQNYETDNIYKTEESTIKINFIRDFIKNTGPRIIWDIGCNTGKYSEEALNAGAEKAIGFEYDMGALELAYKRAKSKHLNFLPLCMDLANPSPSQGWDQSERLGIFERRNADAVLALAIVHHLSIGRNIPLEELLRWLVQLAPLGVVEFIPKSDPMVQELLQLREDIFKNYNITNFESYLLKFARIVKTETITESGRKLFWYYRL